MTLAHDRLQRLQTLRREGVLTDAEYEAKRAALIDEALADGPPARRNAGQVWIGVLGGALLGVMFVGALLVFVPRERRSDRLFGAWLGTAAGAVAVAVLLAVVSVANGSDDGTAVTSKVPGLTQPTAASSLLTRDEACQIALDADILGSKYWRRCTEIRYRAEDRTWVVKVQYFETQTSAIPVDTNSRLIDDKCGRLVGNKACQ